MCLSLLQHCFYTISYHRLYKVKQIRYDLSAELLVISLEKQITVKRDDSVKVSIPLGP